MITFDDYARRYETLSMTRSAEGILEITFHSGGESLRWGLQPHAEMAEAFRFIAMDRENRVVLLTGTGAEFIGPRASERKTYATAPTAQDWERSAYTEARQLLGGLLDIPVPVVGVVNGPALRHCELALLSVIVIASEDASFEDSAHFTYQNFVPGDGMHVVMTMLLGINRARYFLLTGQVIDAPEAHRLGLVNEVVPKPEALERGRAHARKLAQKPDLLLRYTRDLLVQPIKTEMNRLLGLGLALEGLATIGIVSTN